MDVALPFTLSRTHRGICPTCGVPLGLQDAGATTSCEFCGADSRLDYRLRELEPDLEHPPVDPRLEKDAHGLERWHPLLGTHEEAHCPGCGGPFEVRVGHSIAACEHCGMDCKLELRLVAIRPSDVARPERRTTADFRNQGRPGWTHPWDIETEQLFWRLANEPDRDSRVALARQFRSWGTIDSTAAYFLPRLIEQLHREDDAVVREASAVIGKLLCANDETLALPVIQACQRAVLESCGTRWLLKQLGLGPALCIKTLLDAAEAAEQRGERDHAFHALAAVNWIFGRHFDQHRIMARIVVHRLFTSGELVMGWGLRMLRDRFQNGVVLPWQEVLATIDDFAEERPLVVPALRASLFVEEAEDRDEFARRVSMLTALHTSAARAAACTVLGAPPPELELCCAAVKGLEPLLDDPHTCEDATRALLRLLRGDARRVGEALHPLVERRGEGLPDRFKREYLRRYPDTELLDTTKEYFWQSEPAEVVSEEERRLIDAWEQGIERVVIERESPDHVRRIQERASRLDPPLFLEDGPPTLSFVDPEEAREAAEAKERERREREFDRLNAFHDERIQELMEQQSRLAPDDPRQNELIQETSRFVDETTRRMKELMEEPDD